MSDLDWSLAGGHARKMKIQSAALTLMNQGFLSNFLGSVCCLRACHMYSLLAPRVQNSLASCL